MNFRHSAPLLSSALTLLLCGCPNPVTSPDAGDSGVPPVLDGGLPQDSCSGGCAPNQVCDARRLADGGIPDGGLHRVCVDACGGCDAPKVCVRVGTTPTCVVQETKCNGVTCDTGQIACLGGACSCLSSNKAAEDSCKPEGKWCSGSSCISPKRYQQCIPTASPCPTGHTCLPVFGEDLSICTKQCGQPTGGMCEKGELCSQQGCLPSGLFTDQECMQQIPGPDGGAPRKLTVPVSNLCLLKDGSGNPTEPTPSGNCTYQLFSFYDRGSYPIATCRPPGSAVLGGTCKQDFAPAALATQCGTGMECALTRGGDQGVCLKMCNAAPTYPGFNPTPACGMDEACANIYRLEDQNAVLGVCMKKCNVFDPMKNTCANVGTAPASCVPTTADGKFAVSIDGTGVCIPQQVTTATEGMPCAEQDSFKGATCASGQVCASLDAVSAPTCFAVCDTACGGANAPARCATEPNAVCGGSKKCTQVTSTSGATMGFCK